MIIYSYPSADELKVLLRRPEAREQNLSAKVGAILDDVRQRGDEALAEYTLRFDGQSISDFRVSADELASATVAPELAAAMRLAAANIEKFHRAQIREDVVVETMDGVRCWQRSVPISRVGLYIPGGTAPLLSTVLMLAIPARIAGCREVVLCTPPDVSDAILFAAHLCGVKNVFRVGGVQAIGAMAYGTETVPAVDKIFGPGNGYVMAAKQLCGVAIDMPAGPSEVMVLADQSARAEFVAADLLSQAEHGPDSQVILITDSEALAGEVQAEVDRQVAALSRRDIALGALSASRIIIVKNVEQMVEAANIYAPEHLIIEMESPMTVADRVESAGSVFIGHYSPESAGDYASGTNHTLPTSGWAAAFGGVTTDSFMKKITYQQITEQGLSNLSDAIVTMAMAEGLDAHAEAVRVRVKQINR